MRVRNQDRYRWNGDNGLVTVTNQHRILGILVVVEAMLFLQFSVAASQDNSDEKPVPETRQLESQSNVKDSLGHALRSTMPKIDLPEYVITGNAVIDLPAVDKQSAVEDSQASYLVSVLNPPLTRSRQTAQFGVGGKEQIEGTQFSPLNGTASASLGSYFTPQAGLWFGQTIGDYLYSVGGKYYRTKGFKSSTDRSSGSADLKGSTTLKSYNPYFDQSDIHSALTYGSETYHWYGTSNPAVSRNNTSLSLSAGIANWVNSPMPYGLDLGFENFEVSDTSRIVGETRLRIGGETRVMATSVPLNVSLDAQLGSVSYANASTGLSLVELTVASDRYTLNAFSLKGSIGGYLASGMAEQRIVRVYPHLDVAYQVNDRHTLIASYAPEVEPATLSAQIVANKYLSAASTVKHADDQLDATLALESDWSAGVRSKFAARVQSMMDYPLYSDSLSQGIWLLAYGGRTTIASFSAEIFAKMLANDYFAAKLTATSSYNAKIGGMVPYLPAVQLGFSYTKQIVSHWTGVASLSLIHQRKDNVINANTMPGILLIGLRCEYELIRQATIFLDVQNLLDQQYDYWNGYQENPFVLSAGVSLRW